MSGNMFYVYFETLCQGSNLSSAKKSIALHCSALRDHQVEVTAASAFADRNWLPMSTMHGKEWK